MTLTSRQVPGQIEAKSATGERATRYRTVQIDGLSIFYREAGPKDADAASELLQAVFGKDKNPCRSVYGVASLPLGVPVELEVIFEVAP